MPDPERDGRLPLFLEAAAIVFKQVGDQVPINMTTSGPFTSAAGIRGTDKFLRDLHKNPGFAHRLLRLTTDTIIRFGRAAFRVGARIGLADPTSSGTMISSRHFREFALPYLKEVVSAIAETTGAPLRSISAATRLKSGAKWRHRSLDTQSRQRHRSCRSQGSGRPSGGAAGQYSARGRHVPGKTGGCAGQRRGMPGQGLGLPKGYILGLGCGLPIDTPPENIHALVAAAREFGRWPLDPARFAQSGVARQAAVV